MDPPLLPQPQHQQQQQQQQQQRQQSPSLFHPSPLSISTTFSPASSPTPPNSFRTPSTPRIKRRSMPYPPPPYPNNASNNPGPSSSFTSSAPFHIATTTSTTPSSSSYPPLPLSSPPVSTFSPPPSSASSPTKPTSSLARRRRSSVIISPSTATIPDPLATAGAMLHHSLGLTGVEREAQTAINGRNDTAMTNGGGEGDDKIAQAMTLLSLHPLEPKSDSVEAHWPDTEELLKESLRQSLDALRAIQTAKSGRAGEVASTILAMQAAQAGMRSARETLSWAEQRVEMEAEEWRARLLRGD